MANRVAAKSAAKPRLRRSAPAPEQAFYVYGVTRGDQTAPHIRSRGVDGAAMVEHVPCGGLLCWFSRVPASDFGAALPEKMQDLDWLAAAGVRHQRVVSEIAARSEILPTRFGTVFLSERSMVEDVRRRKRALDSIFKKIAGCDEWGVKVFALPQPVAAAKPASSGTEYLAQKAALRTVEPRKALAPALEHLATELSKLAVDATAGGAVSGGRPGLVWQAAFLIPRRNRLRLERLLERFAAKEKTAWRIECTGPWPPYSFVHRHGR